MLLGFDVGSLYELEKTVRQEIESHGKPQREAATQKRPGAENRATAGELVAPPKGKEGAAQQSTKPCLNASSTGSSSWRSSPA
jgi:hypothetical protein